MLVALSTSLTTVPPVAVNTRLVAGAGAVLSTSNVFDVAVALVLPARSVPTIATVAVPSPDATV